MLTTREVADRLGVPVSRYRFWEKQLSPAIESQYGAALARCFGVATECITHGVGFPPPGIQDGGGLDAVASKDSPTTAGCGSAEPMNALVALGPVELEELGQRCRERRCLIGLNRAEATARAGLTIPTLAKWETRLPRRPKADKEALLEEVLMVPRGWLRDRSMVAPPVEDSWPVLGTTTVSEAGSVADEIRAIGTWLVRNSPRKRTFQYAELTVGESRLVDIFALRYGVGGEDATTLQSIGDRYGLTRERIRQMVSKMVERAHDLKVATPHLDRVCAEVKLLVPAPLDSLDKVLQPMLGSALSLRSAAQFAREILGRSIVTLTDQPADMSARWDVVAIAPEGHDAERLRAVREMSLRMIRSCGAAHLYFVTGAVASTLKEVVTPDEVARCLKTIPGFSWLAEDDGWYWLGPDSESRVLSVTKKVLAAAGQAVDVEDIMGALARSRRNHSDPDRARPWLVEISAPILVAALKRVPWLEKVQMDDFRLRDGVDPGTLLSHAEQAIYEVLRQSGGITARHTLTKRLVHTGVLKAVTMHLALNSSPVLVRLDRGVFAIRGARFAPDAMGIASAAVGGESSSSYSRRMNQDEDGWYSCCVRLSSYVFRRRIFEVPTSLARFMTDGPYLVEGFTEPAIYRALPGGARRLKQFASKLADLGMQPEDQVILRLAPKERRMEVVCSTGGDGAVCVVDHE